MMGARLASTGPPVADFYALLGVSRDATPEKLKQGFREQAKLHHPDMKRGKGTEADLNLFKAINEAYTVLSDPGAW